MNHRQHNPCRIGEVGFTAMPQPQVADDDRALLDPRLGWWSFFRTLYKQGLFDSAAGALSVLAFLGSRA